eukprot:SM000120S25677  [mRNA]  locus=s120:8550:11282:+ [translate_table: standard]
MASAAAEDAGVHDSQAEALPKKSGLLVYGATGHTGRLVARKILELGLDATLAGRNQDKLRSVAESGGGLPYEAVDLKNTAALGALVARHKVVLHIAGPFTDTAAPMLDACLEHGTHYLDITGEVGAIRATAGRDAVARAAGIMLLPAAGFDAVPGDCLAAYLKEHLPTATHLDIATFIVRAPPGSKGATASQGTLLSGLLHILPAGGLERAAGDLRCVHIGAHIRSFEPGDGRGAVAAFSFPAAELVCAAHSTNIPNIVAYVPGGGGGLALQAALAGIRLAAPLLTRWPVKDTLEGLVKWLPQPDDSKAGEVRMVVTAEARDEEAGSSGGATARRASVVVGPGYPFTASSSVEIARRVLAGDFKEGFQTPASAYGPDLVLSIPGERAERIDVP